MCYVWGMYKLSSDETHAISVAVGVVAEHLTEGQLEAICTTGWNKATELLMKEQDIPVTGEEYRDRWLSRYSALQREASFLLWGQAMMKTGKRVEEVIRHGSE